MFSKQRHALAFHLQLTQINEHWPGLAIAVPDAEPPFYEFWQTVNVPLVVGHLFSWMQLGNAAQQYDASLPSVQRDRRAEHACQSSAYAFWQCMQWCGGFVCSGFARISRMCHPGGAPWGAQGRSVSSACCGLHAKLGVDMASVQAWQVHAFTLFGYHKFFA